ncbi:ENR1 protein, partial [Jacana jacana]|nr:ENR1 protein [Jacana jacana]
MLSRISWLQAAVELIMDKTAQALEIKAAQPSQSRAAGYQHQLVLDYLWASERGLCGKV